MRGRKGGPLHRGEHGAYDAHRHWVPLPVLLPDEERVVPETVPNSYLHTHPQDCACDPCRRYPDQRSLVKQKIRESARRPA